MDQIPTLRAGTRFVLNVGRSVCLSRKTAIFVGGLVSFVFAVIIIENVRGLRAWTACRAQAEALGADFSLERLLPSSDVPPKENFASIPLIRAALDARNGKRPHLTEFDIPGRGLAAAMIDGAPCDFRLLRSALTEAEWIEPGEFASEAEACARGLTHYDPALAEIREGARRPYARYPRDLDHPENTGVPPFLVLRKIAQVLRLRFEAHAASGDLDAACDDFELAQAIARTLDQNTTLVSAMIQGSLTNITIDGLSSWLHTAPWNATQLTRFSNAMAGLDLLRSVSRSFAVERALLVNLGTRLGRGQEPTFLELVDTNTASEPQLLAEKARRVAWQFYPRGWHYQSLVWTNPYYAEIQRHLDADGHRWLPGTTDAEEMFATLGPIGRLRLALAMIAVPNFQRAEWRTAAVQAQLDLARFAVELQRHHLVRGEYPDRLDDLVPTAAGLPLDLTDGKPMRYRPGANGRFLLYSLSYNRTDEGGSSAADPKAPGVGIEFDRLDWVWAPARNSAATALR